jgi:threonine dehydratase
MNPVTEDGIQWIRREVLEAEERIRQHIFETPLEYSRFLSKYGKCQAFLKLENVQKTRSFKIRGALNKTLSLSDSERKGGVITASSGNHGAAMAHVFRELKIEGKIFLPANASPAKVDTLRLLGAQLEFHGEDCVEAEGLAHQTAVKRGLPFISPYNDPLIIAGQGTVALEVDRVVKGIDAVLTPVGGGGLISGVAGYFKNVHPDVQQIGCQPVNSAVMYESVQAGHILELESKPTLADGTAGGIEADSITFEICRACVDSFILVTEEEIKRALSVLIGQHHILVEGAGALSTAAFLRDLKRFAGKTVVLIVSGARISMEGLRSILFADGVGRGQT